MDVQEFFSQDGRSFVDGCSGAVEGTTQHFFGDRHLHGLACELTVSVEVVNARSALEDLGKGRFTWTTARLPAISRT